MNAKLEEAKFLSILIVEDVDRKAENDTLARKSSSA